MSDPVEWLSNRLDEVEGLATSAEIDAGSPWRTEGNYRDVPDIVVASTPLPGYTRPTYWLWNSEEDVSGSPAVAAHVAGMDPATVLQLVAATRALLELHERWELGEYEYTGNPIVTIEDGVTYRHWPAGSITGERQVGVRYECWHCMNSDESHMDWPCPTLRAVAAGWGWVDE